jgi:predicted XRE-type DNA-binding protein
MKLTKRFNWTHSLPPVDYFKQGALNGEVRKTLKDFIQRTDGYFKDKKEEPQIRKRLFTYKIMILLMKGYSQLEIAKKLKIRNTRISVLKKEFFTTTTKYYLRDKK